ncbi:MAG: hypothetical protein ACO3QU_06005 [Ilumatobacteraceae bacterium]
MVSSLKQLAAISTDLAITLVVPAEPTGENRAFESHLNRMLAEALDQATEFGSKRAARRLVQSIRDRVEQLSRANLSKGVWIGAHNDDVYVYQLDDETLPQVSVSRSLNVLPLVRQARHANALVLMLTETGCRLASFHARGATVEDRMRSLRVPGLPAKFHGEGARKGRESEGDQVDGRYRQWLRDVARITVRTQRKYPVLGRLPLIVVGVDRYIAYLTEVADSLEIAAVIHGSPDAFTTAELDSRIGVEVDWLRNERVVKALNRATRDIGAGRTSVDLAETRRWAELGRVDSLILEDGVTSDEVLALALDVYSRAGEVLSAPTGAISAHLPVLAPSHWVATLRW